MLIDTHCHIHSKNYLQDADLAIKTALKDKLSAVIVVGDSIEDSKRAIDFSKKYLNCFASVGVHPHNVTNFNNFNELEELAKNNKIVAIGECGLDYFYNFSPKEIQLEVLRFQLELANKLNLPLSLHIRGSKDNPNDAFEDYFKLHDDLINRGKLIKGVVHSFTSGQAQLKGVLSRSLYVGINGIYTFADAETQATINSVPLESLMLETDAPYLTPVPKRGKINEPKYVVLTAEFLAKQRGIDFVEVAKTTTNNAKNLFNLEV